MKNNFEYSSQDYPVFNHESEAMAKKLESVRFTIPPDTMHGISHNKENIYVDAVKNSHYVGNFWGLVFMM